MKKYRRKGETKGEEKRGLREKKIIFSIKNEEVETRERKGAREREREGEREGGREGGREGKREGEREGGRKGGREGGRERERESHNTNYSQSFISNIIECPEVRGPVSMTESSLKWKQSTHHLTQLTLPEYTCNNNIN